MTGSEKINYKNTRVTNVSERGKTFILLPLTLYVRFIASALMSIYFVLNNSETKLKCSVNFGVENFYQ